METPTQRNLVLDGLRGFFAISVVIYHIIRYTRINGIDIFQQNIFTDIQSGSNTLILCRILLSIFNGGLAIYTFFTLSGYVLTLSLLKDTSSDFFKIFKNYSVKRILRIFPAHMISLCIISVILAFYGLKNNDIYTAIYTRQILAEVDLYSILSNLFLFSYKINPPSWTLFYELYFVLTFPFIIFSLKNLKEKKTLSMLLYIFPFYISLFIFSFHQGLYGSYQNLLPFILGVAIAYNNSKVKEFKFFSNSILPVIIMASLPRAFLSDFSSLTMVFESMMAGLIILICVTRSKDFFKELLLTRFFQTLGKVSFGFYITNTIFLFLFNDLFTSHFADIIKSHNILIFITIISMINIISTFLFAVYVIYPIEKFFMKLGNHNK